MATQQEIEQLRASMRAAQVFGKGQYILKGLHILQVQKLFYKRTLIEGVAKESIICEFTVLQTNNPEMVVGETRSIVFGFEKKGWLSRFKAMCLAFCGVDPDGAVTEAAQNAAMDVYAALKFEEERTRLQLPENFMAGTVVKVEGIPGTIKTGANIGKPIVDLKWTPYTAPAAAAQ